MRETSWLAFLQSAGIAVVIMVMVKLGKPRSGEKLVIDREGSQYVVMERNIYSNAEIKGNLLVL